MDITKRKLTQKKQSPKIWIAVIASMAVIVAIWGLWLYPSSIKLTRDQEAQSKFLDFKNKLNSAFSIFDKENSTPVSEEVDIQDLRERVFGDTTKRSE
jgi:hypothetical protein|tara:strand:+ start:99 stop:392 length:294 start_codon:yes stop_codon:yes gene_type:complete